MIERRVLDRFRKPVRLVAGAAVVGFTSASTIDGVSAFVAGAHGLIVGYSIGAILALAIFLVQVFTGEDPDLLLFYLAASVPDTYFTYLWLDWLVGGIMRANGAKTASIIAICLPLSIVAAYIGERLLFGKRRRKGKGHANRATRDASDAGATLDHGSI